MAHQIIEFSLEVDIQTFLDTFWYSNEFYFNYLKVDLLDKEIDIGEWNVSDNAEEDGLSKVRHVQSQHPCKVSFPGLPSHAASAKIQKINFERESEGELTILESNTFQGIPMADYFRVDTLWCVRQRRVAGGSAGTAAVDIAVTGEVVFLYSTWLKGSIESNTYAELDDVFASWRDAAVLHLQTQALAADKPEESHPEVTTDALSTAIIRMPPLFPSSSSPGPGSSHSSQSDGELDDFYFYDCEEGRGSLDEEDVTGEPLRGGGGSSLLAFRDQLLQRRQSGDHLLTPQELMDMYDQVERGGGGSSEERDHEGEREGLLAREGRSLQPWDDERVGARAGEKQGKPLRRYIAITVVEIGFVLAESFFWQVKRMYKHDLTELFRIEPIDVARRVAASFVPGKHTPLLASPDLYGPAVAASLLPQVMLMAMDSAHHGCSRGSLLGDAVVVSMCLWGGLAGLYRVFGVLVAPLLNFKHCLCLTGYSLYPWICALSLSSLFDAYPNDYISPQMPLYFLGLPAAIAQGYVFWEYTPLAFRHAHLDQLLPLSLRALSMRHRGRVSENVLWYIPKALVLIVIAVTHYQFLWYVAHTFLPGRRHLCHLSSLLNPANYADILSQKELRSFAVEVAKTVA